MFVESAREKCFLAFTATSCLISFLNGLHSTCTASWSFVRCPFRFTSTSLCLLVWYFNHFLMKSQYMETLKSLFTAFYPCFVIIFLEKITSFMLGTWYCTWCFLRFFLGKNVFSHPLQLCLHLPRCFITFSNILDMLQHKMVLVFTWI